MDTSNLPVCFEQVKVSSTLYAKSDHQMINEKSFNEKYEVDYVWNSLLTYNKRVLVCNYPSQ